MSDVEIINGNVAAAVAAKLSRVQVVAAYPITPSSKIPEALVRYIENGELEAEFINVESEHTAMTVCISASTVGARVFTATAANGLAYMHEQLHWAAGARLPVVMAVANRGMGAPWTIFNDMQDSISQRDTGWIQIYCRNNQEIVDNIIQAYKIAERLYVPVMVCFDGFLLSHTVMPVHVPDQERVDKFLPSYRPYTCIPSSNSVNINPVVLSDPMPNAHGVACPSYMGFRMRLQKTMEQALSVAREVGKEFNEIFGRDYGHTIWQYKTGDADVLLLGMGSLVSEASVAVDQLRDQGAKAGVVGIRVFRPFPKEELLKCLCNASLLVVFDKNISYGYEGATCTETKAALFGSCHKPAVFNYIVGLGGKNVKTSELVDATIRAMKQKGPRDAPEWLGVTV